MTETHGSGFYIPQMDAGNLLLLARRAGAQHRPGERVLYRPAGTDTTTPATVRAVLAHITVRMACPGTSVPGPSQQPIDWDVSGGAHVEYRLWLKGENVSASENEVLPAETDAHDAR